MVAFMMVSVSLLAIGSRADLINDMNINVERFGPAWDVNNDGTTDYIDASRIVLHFSEEGPPGWIWEDLYVDGRVDYIDCSIFVRHFSEGWLTP